jgi:hypothetical protein
MGSFERAAVSARSKRSLDFYGMAVLAGLSRSIGVVWLTSHNRKNEILANGEILAKLTRLSSRDLSRFGA